MNCESRIVSWLIPSCCCLLHESIGSFIDRVIQERLWGRSFNESMIQWINASIAGIPCFNSALLKFTRKPSR